MAVALLKYYFNKIRGNQKSEAWQERVNDPIPEPESGEKLFEVKMDEIKSELDGTAEDLKKLSKKLLSVLARKMEISQGMFFLVDNKKGTPVIRYISGYANSNPGDENLEYEFGQGFSGQVAKDGKLLNISSVPEGYLSILSGLGESSPKSLIIFPVLDKNRVLAVIELASFKEFSISDEEILLGITPIIAGEILRLRKKQRQK